MRVGLSSAAYRWYICLGGGRADLSLRQLFETFARCW